MKRKSMYCAVAIAAALAFSAMAGCSSQPASQASASSASASASQAASASAAASESAEKSQDEIIAELKESLSNIPAYTSVTITEKAMSWGADDAEAAEEGSSASAASSGTAEADAVDDIVESTTVYKFDESGDKPKTSAAIELADIKLQYYTDGDDAVCVTDGPVYSGTVEQFGLSHAAGADAYLKDSIGDLNALVDCIATVTQDDINGVTNYALTLDPAKYIESDEILKLAADSGDPIQEAAVTVGFDKDGRIVWMTKMNSFSKINSTTMLDLADYDSTVVDPMPKATKTYEEMEADMKAKIDALDDELENEA